VFAVREFRALWSAQALSCAGDQFAQVAIAFMVYARTGSAFLTAAAYALTYLPPVIGGAALDVFEREPSVDPQLLGLENVVLVPHLGSATHETRRAMGMLCVDALESVLLGTGNAKNFVVGSGPQNLTTHP